MPESPKQPPSGLPRHRLIGLAAGPLAAAALVASPAPDGLSQEGWWIAACGLWMAVWWMTEAVPLAATALLPLILFPLLGVRGIAAVAPSYAHPLIFLFLGGFMLARAMHVWRLDRRLALTVLRFAGSSPRGMIGGIMAVTAFLSMWVSNTATAMVMLPIGLSIIATVPGQKAPKDHTPGQAREHTDSMAPALLLGIAYAATIGGMGTIIGTPPNALFAAFMADSYGIEIGFLRWMLIGVPLVLVLLPIAWLVLTRLAFRVGGRDSLETEDAIGERLAGLRALPMILLLLALGALIVFVGELASNTAMAAVFLPVAGATALGMGEPAFVLALPVALFATLGFMLPVATPPNAIVFGSGAVEMRHMLRAGAVLDVVGIVVVALAIISLGQWVLGPA